MKRLLALMLSVAMLFTLSGCKRQDDIKEISKAGKIIIGITDYEPMNYKVDGEWTGFDTELARLFAKELGVEAEFKEIEWAKRYDELIDYNIDCIWNAMTVLERTQNHITVSDSYIINSQILVVRADEAKNFESGYGLKKYKFVSEENSSGEAIVFNESYHNSYTVKTQQQALEAVACGEADATIIDSIMADTLVGEGKRFDTLKKSLIFSDESCAVGFRKNSPLVERFNSFLDDKADNELIDLANKYGLTLY